jgi:hypothetical protein
MAPRTRTQSTPGSSLEAATLQRALHALGDYAHVAVRAARGHLNIFVDDSAPVARVTLLGANQYGLISFHSHTGCWEAMPLLSRPALDLCGRRGRRGPRGPGADRAGRPAPGTGSPSGSGCPTAPSGSRPRSSAGGLLLGSARLDMSFLTIILTLTPVVTCLWSIIVFGGRPPATEIGGGIATLAGVLLVTVSRAGLGQRPVVPRQ